MKDEVFHFFYRAKVTSKVYQKVRNHLDEVGGCVIIQKKR